MLRNYTLIGARWSWRTAFTVSLLAALFSTYSPAQSNTGASRDSESWIGTWATAPQPFLPRSIQTFRNQTLRLIVHTSAGGTRVRIRISNSFGDQPLLIGAAHIARRASAADIDPDSDRPLKFRGHSSITIAPRSIAVSDPVDLDVPALSDLAISLFLPETTAATTSHILALQTSYFSPETGDSTGSAKFPVAKTITSWPFLTGVDVLASSRAASIVAFGSSTTDGDGSTKDANRRWPDVLAERLRAEPLNKAASEDAGVVGVLNEGIIGNRLLSDSSSPRQAGGPFGAVLERFGAALGSAGLLRFERDVLDQAGVKYVIVALGVNDILFPGSFIPLTESVTAQSLISANRQMIARAHKNGIRVIATTIPPFEDAIFDSPRISFYTPEKEAVRREVNAWIRSSGEFDGVVDFDEVVRDPNHPTRLLPRYDSGDHLHVNDAGNVAQGNAIPLALFRSR
jgi:lysophospholipase L1-like esterase